MPGRTDCAAKAQENAKDCRVANQKRWQPFEMAIKRKVLMQQFPAQGAAELAGAD